MAAFAASLALLFGHPFVCHTSVAAYNAAVGEPASVQWVWGVGGFYRWADGTIGLTPGACSAASRIGSGWPTLPQSIAVFTIAHELGHAAVGPDEQAADCYGAGRTQAVARALGVRGRERLWTVTAFVRDYAGYDPIPAACFTRAPVPVAAERAALRPR